MWNAWVLWVFVFPHAPNSILETEDNSIPSQLYDFSIIQAGAVYQYEMTSIVTKSSGVRDLPLVYLFSAQTLPKRLKYNKVDIYMFKIKM